MDPPQKWGNGPASTTNHRGISYATGVNIIMGSGWYQKQYHPEDMDQCTVEDMTLGSRREAEKAQIQVSRLVSRFSPGVAKEGTRPRLKPSGETGSNGDLPQLPQGTLATPRTTNPVESPFAALRLRTDAAKPYKRVDRATAVIWKMLMLA